MKETTFTINETTIRTSDLKKHDFVDKMGYLKPDDFTMAHIPYLKAIKRPLVTEDLFYLTCPDFVESALKTGTQEIQVIMITGATINDLFKIINLENRVLYKASKSLLYKTIKTLQQHLWNTPEGKHWYESIPGSDINHKIAYLVGYGASTVGNIKRVGDKDYCILDQIDDPDADMTLTKAMRMIAKEEELNEKKDNYDGFSASNNDDIFDTDDESEEEYDFNEDGNGEEYTEPEKDTKIQSKKTRPKKVKEPCDAKLMGFTIDFGKYGEYQLYRDNNGTAILMNGDVAGFVKINPSKDNDLNEALHFTVQNADEHWSFQILATRIHKLLKKQEVGSYKA